MNLSSHIWTEGDYIPDHQRKVIQSAGPTSLLMLNLKSMHDVVKLSVRKFSTEKARNARNELRDELTSLL